MLDLSVASIQCIYLVHFRIILPTMHGKSGSEQWVLNDFFINVINRGSCLCTHDQKTLQVVTYRQETLQVDTHG